MARLSCSPQSRVFLRRDNAFRFIDGMTHLWAIAGDHAAGIVEADDWGFGGWERLLARCRGGWQKVGNVPSGPGFWSRVPRVPIGVT